MNQPLEIAEKAFEDFEKKVDSLEYLELELKQLNFYGFREEAKEIKTMLKDTAQIPFIESKLKELKARIEREKAGRGEKQRTKWRSTFLTWWDDRKKEIDKLRLERQKQVELEKDGRERLRLERQRQKEQEKEKLRIKEQETITRNQIDEIERDIGESSKKSPLVEDILRELNQEINSKKSQKSKISEALRNAKGISGVLRNSKAISDRLEAKSQSEPIEEKKEPKPEVKPQPIIKQHKTPTVAELVQQTKQRFAQKKTESMSKKEDILSTLKETFELKHT